MSESDKPEPKRTLTVRKKQHPQRVKLRKTKVEPVEEVHKIVHHTHEVIKAAKAVYEVAKPIIDKVRRR